MKLQSPQDLTCWNFGVKIRFVIVLAGFIQARVQTMVFNVTTYCSKIVHGGSVT